MTMTHLGFSKLEDRAGVPRVHTDYFLEQYKQEQKKLIEVDDDLKVMYKDFIKATQAERIESIIDTKRLLNAIRAEREAQE